MVWLNSFGKQHLSTTSVKKVYGDREKNNFDIFTIASIMSSWWTSDAQQAPCQAPQQNQIQQGACKDTMRFRTKTGTQPSSVLDANTLLYFLGQQRYRSKVTSLCVSSRQTFNLLKPTAFPFNPSEGRINELGISKDFGNDCFIFKDNSGTDVHGPIEQNCKLQTRKLGECETVQTSVKKGHKNIEFQSSSLIVLGILPLLSSVLELKNFTKLMVSQVQVFKKLISFAITVRLFVLRAFLKKLEYLRLQVNKTFFRESNENHKNLNLNVSSAKVVNQVLSDMALNQQIYPGWRMEEDELLQREEDEEGQDDTNYREVPDFHHQHQSGGNGEDDDVEMWDDRFRGEEPQEVFDGLPGGPVPINFEPVQLQEGWFTERYITNFIPD